MVVELRNDVIIRGVLDSADDFMKSVVSQSRRQSFAHIQSDLPCTRIDLGHCTRHACLLIYQ